MIFYIVRRLLYTILVLIVASMVTFVLIQLPPGDYLTTYANELQNATGQILDQTVLNSLRHEYGLDQPIYVQYAKWVRNMFHGDFGRSFTYNKPVIDLIGERIGLTVVISLLTLLFTYVIAIPIGVYSATHQYSVGDHIFTIIGFAGLATPNFILGLILIYLFNKYFGVSVGGLFSIHYATQPWSVGKVLDLLKHLPVPIIVVGTAGTAGIIRVMRGTLLDELRKQYVVTARAKGVTEQRLLFRYPVRVALNPIVSTIGWLLPQIVSGATITAVVLGLPTVGPMLLKSLLNQDMYLAGSLVLFLTFLTLIGSLISDMLLLAIDPRIRFEQRVRA